ncbi:hypothetical protein GlitD10_1638 [Gloeomargarita lithophora Alchichica-D10]|uniref:N-acetylneuraminate synthase n=1 Tax=Gloeomargarita lithophora Alchichica-D10 TaxID=1188229 RepID=A0A1J0ADF0_9CYAN|nr:hypothetical protein GlitD10_1638 [Gloeomargarita lithophora Alchichica-D10]
MNINLFGLNPLFVIAEMSGNHNQSLERALEIIEAVGTIVIRYLVKWFCAIIEIEVATKIFTPNKHLILCN